MDWIGYKVHFTETCDEARAHLITHVETTHAAVPDEQALPQVHEALAKQELLPEIHLVDAGYTSMRQGAIAGQTFDERKHYHNAEATEWWTEKRPEFRQQIMEILNADS
jgi:hypothetical protein